jgi:cytochrome c-type biogenesis protein CcmH
MRRLIFFTLTLLIIFIGANSALAQEPDPDRVNEIAKQMNCPTCIGVNLADCRTQTCEQWRGQIADLLAQGYSDQEVLDYFVNQYGVQVLLEPPKSGTTLLLWVLPVLALLAGGAWLFYTMRRWRTTVAPAPSSDGSAASIARPAPPEVDNDYLSQVEKDLRGKE